MSACPNVTVFNHVRKNEHYAVLKFLKLLCPFPNDFIDIQMSFYAV